MLVDWFFHSFICVLVGMFVRYFASSHCGPQVLHVPGGGGALRALFLMNVVGNVDEVCN